MASPRIHTYHCLCTHLLLASTATLSSFPTRQKPPSLDGAVIVPLPPPPRIPSTSHPDSDSESDEGSAESRTASKQTKDVDLRREPYTLLLSTTQDRRPLIIRRDDGFEKRRLVRCGRCRVVVGYVLDEVHYETTASTAMRSSETGPGRPEDGKSDRVKVVYLLPGGLLSTAEMAEGKKPEDWELG
ncbi:MAG: hypothetical protein M1817_006190 [Caeruleum heppii]|nr:MAG: hypothetical protein M1817_006190 [Caeruleum heppii]